MRNILWTLMRLIGHQEYLRFGVRKRMIRVLWNRLGKKHSFEVDFFGMRYQGDLEDYIDRCVYFFGGYEKGVLSLLRDRALALPSKGVFVDIGANVGQHSLYMSRFCREVHAFEPFPPNVSKIREKVLINNIKNIKIHPVGLGNIDGVLPFSPPPTQDMGIGTFLNYEEKSSRVLLPVKIADEYFPKHRIEPSLIKIDVEGFEARVLAGMRKILKIYKPLVMMECSVMLLNEIEGVEQIPRLFPYPVRIWRIVDQGNWSYRLVSSVEGPSDILVVPAEDD